jgi:hypothetical protein
MKMIYAGNSIVPIPYQQLLFNCTRNQKCEREFFVPVQNFSDIMLYVELPGKPDLIDIEVLDVCDDMASLNATTTAYSVGQKPDGAWYGVFGALVLPPNDLRRFVVVMNFLVDGVIYYYYSQQYEFPFCNDLKFIRGCYPEEPIGADAEDCNGIYYGFPTNEDFLGLSSFRYIHSAFVRMGSVIEQNNRMQFTAFNSRKTYKTVFNREWLFEFELVPTFYKDHLVGIFNRGNVEVAGTVYKLAETQDISITDVDSKLWRMDMIFDSECKQNFGCASGLCGNQFPEDYILDFFANDGNAAACCDVIEQADLGEYVKTLNGGVWPCIDGSSPVFTLESWNPAILVNAPVLDTTMSELHFEVKCLVESFIPVEIFRYRITCANGQFGIGVVRLTRVNCDALCSWGDCERFACDLIPDGLYNDLFINWAHVASDNCETEPIDGFEYAVVEHGQDAYPGGPTFPFIAGPTVVSPASSPTIVEDLQEGPYDVWVRILCPVGDTGLAEWRIVSVVGTEFPGQSYQRQYNCGFGVDAAAACAANTIIYISNAHTIIETGAILKSSIFPEVAFGDGVVRRSDGTLWNVVAGVVTTAAGSC